MNATLTLLQSNGSPNLAFGTDGTNGTTTTMNEGGNSFDYAVTDLAIESDGSILMLVNGVALSGGSYVDDVLLHFSSTGTQDLTFGQVYLGTPVGVILPFTGQMNLISVLPNGEILAAGMADTAMDTVVVSRLQANGAPDTSFGNGGVAEYSISNSGPQVPIGLDVTMQGIVVGIGSLDGYGDVQLIRFTSAGQLDPNFGGAAGFVGQGGNGYGYTGVLGMAIDADAGNDVVIIGSTYQQQLQLQQFNTVSESWRVYAEQDADGNVISISDSSGNVLERYAYDDYGNVTVLNPDGTVRGDGTAASSLYGWVNLYQGLRYDPATGLYYDRDRQTLDPTLGRFLQQDPTGPDYVNGVNLYQDLEDNPTDRADPSGLSLILFPSGAGGDQSDQTPSMPGQTSLATLGYGDGSDSSSGIFDAPVQGTGGMISLLALNGQMPDEAMNSSDSRAYGDSGSDDLAAEFASDNAELMRIVNESRYPHFAPPAPLTEQEYQWLSEGNGLESDLSPAFVMTAPLTGVLAVGEAEAAAVGGDSAASVTTPYGTAVQSFTPEATALRNSVEEGQQIFRAGNFPKSAGAEGQFWSPQCPLTPGYANSVGAANLGANTPDFILGGNLSPEASFITRSAPAYGGNAGGALEIVTQPGGVQIQYFHMP